MPIEFAQLKPGELYSRQILAELWSYKTFHALARGVVTPAGDNKIVLFVTENKQTSSEQYEDKLHEKTLDWEGPNDHFAEKRMLATSTTGEEIHLFHRERHHSDFVYVGQLKILQTELNIDKPSRFRFQIQSA
ncbi:DUF3427 domain-containing protein [Edaphobacter modestus]|uniref:Uncharacterized protein DUF3427 n=1 Tax=Edaphobacter modestus TaxID=388466 RepID=A0A4Q7Z005_9BACT|nr:DUF3427 domain-containing protein [Edaphobacter modestus]RZU42789.1 uncharacterized protein DUF3427 [Edaphobacter modestus]